MENITLPSEQQVLAFVAAQEAVINRQFRTKGGSYFSATSGYEVGPDFYGCAGDVRVHGKTLADMFAALEAAVGPAGKRARAAELRAEAEKLEKEAAS